MLMADRGYGEALRLQYLTDLAMPTMKKAGTATTAEAPRSIPRAIPYSIIFLKVGPPRKLTASAGDGRFRKCRKSIRRG